MTLLIADPGFVGMAGHHFEWNRAFAEEGRRRGVDVRIAAHRDVASDGLPVARVFTHSIYDEVIAPASRREIREWSVADFASLKVSTNDVLLVHSTARAHFCALADWIAALPEAERPRCVVLHNVGWFGGEWTVGRHDWSADLREAASRLSASARVTYGAIHPTLCADWEAHAGAPARVHPIPCPVIVEGAAVPRIASLGGGRAEKGFELLPEILANVLRDCPGAEALVQSNPVHASSRTAAERLRDLPRVRVHEGAASPDEYRRLLGDAGIFLLPYDPFWYRARGSGIFFEAMASGIPAVLPAGTWMADEWARYGAGGALFHDWSARAIAASAASVVRSFDEQRERSRRAAVQWNARHSVAAFMDFVLTP